MRGLENLCSIQLSYRRVGCSVAGKSSRAGFKRELKVRAAKSALVDDSDVTCLEIATGKVVWKEKIGGSYAASPIYADGRLYFGRLYT